MNNPDECPNTTRMLDWMGHCRTQHEELNRLLHEIHAALHGNGREGLVSRVARNSQRIDVVDTHVKDMRVDVDKRFDILSKKLSMLDTRFWKMAASLGVILITLQKTIPPLDWWTKMIAP
jgi:hypothetical protein